MYPIFRSGYIVLNSVIELFQELDLDETLANLVPVPKIQANDASPGFGSDDRLQI